jgi:dihydrofolate reductase
VRTTNLDWTFVTTGLPDAVTAARERAEAAASDSGKDLDVILMGGGATIGSALDAGLACGARHGWHRREPRCRSPS